VSTNLKEIYHGKRILVTGHTGFKGSWLVKYLEILGANVCGLSLDPEPNSIFLTGDFIPLNGDFRIDLLDRQAINNFFLDREFDLVFHLAAQPLVSRAYEDPIHTFDVNIIGTANLILECSKLKSCLGMVLATTDKVYRPSVDIQGHTEIDPLGGLDPYSASKSAAEAIIVGMRNAIPSDIHLASVRAGNVIGGGDFAENRLIPDIIRAIKLNNKLIIRNPDFVRPWTHVLDILSGYLLVGAKIITNQLKSYAYNFGPRPAERLNVEQVVKIARESWKERSDIEIQLQPSYMKEDSFLALNSDLARKELGWESFLGTEFAIKKTVDWWVKLENGIPSHLLVDEDIRDYLAQNIYHSI